MESYAYNPPTNICHRCGMTYNYDGPHDSGTCRDEQIRKLTSERDQWKQCVDKVQDEVLDLVSGKSIQPETLTGKMVQAMTARYEEAVAACRRLCEYNGGWVGPDPQLHKIKDAAMAVVAKADAKEKKP